MAGIPIGARAQRKLLVTGEVAIDFLGRDAARVLATPFLVAQLEMASRDAVTPYLEKGYDTVGTHINLRHLAATPMGLSVTFHAEVTAVDDRRITFKVWAVDEVEKIAEGSHERFVINVERFAQRLQAKAQRRQGDS